MFELASLPLRASSAGVRHGRGHLAGFARSEGDRALHTSQGRGPIAEERLDDLGRLLAMADDLEKRLALVNENHSRRELPLGIGGIVRPGLECRWLWLTEEKLSAFAHGEGKWRLNFLGSQ